jgi:GNAT superfamily N-acetyltransferase
MTDTIAGMRPSPPSAAAIPYAWRSQPDGISCGPTCIAMVRDGLAARAGLPPGPGTEAVAAMCGTNTRTGTTHEGVAVALAGLGLAGRRVTGRAGFREAFRDAMQAGNPVLLRTLTHGYKHWVLATHARPDGRIRILDPGLGDATRSESEIEALVAPRAHEIWPVEATSIPFHLSLGPLVPPGSSRGAREAAIREAVALARDDFAPLLDGGDLRAYLDDHADWALSRALRVDGRLVGAYLLKERPVTAEAPEARGSDVDRPGAVEGVGLVVAPEGRGRGWGRLLRDQPRALGYGVVWGLQDKRLGNLDRWLARRTLVHDIGHSWVTAEILPRPGHRAVPDPGAAYGA